MILLQLKLKDKYADRHFLDYCREGVLETVKEVFSRKSKREKRLLALNLQELSRRYNIEASPGAYIDCLLKAIAWTVKNTILTVQVSKKNRYYRLIKSIELGSYKIVATPILGQVLAVMPFLLDRLYTDYEIVLKKLAYYKAVNSVRYKLLMRHSLYKISNRLNGKVKLM